MGISPFSSNKYKEHTYSKSRFSVNLINEYSKSKLGVISPESKNDYSQLPNPNPKNYTIEKHKQCGSSLVVKIKYHDCTNYEGIKILVFKKTDINQLLAQKLIDPHFCENKKFLSPIARFEPTNNGWDDAVWYAFYVNEKN